MKSGKSNNNLKVKNLLFNEDVAKLFDSVINSVVAESGLSNQEFQKKMKDKFIEILNSFDKLLIEFYLNNNKFSLEDFLSTHSKNQEKIVLKNSDSFKWFFIYINCSDMIYDKICNSLKRKRLTETLKLNIALYGLIIRKAQQIATMLIDGYIDGAMIIWRSLYENAIALIVLFEENNDQLALKFSTHSIKNSKKKILSYMDNYKEMKFRPLSKKTVGSINEKEEKVSELYGKDFIENEFGWADNLFPGKQKANLRLLEKRINFSRYRPYYLLCSEHIHLGFNALNDYREKNKVVLPEILRQDTDLKRFIDPMQFTISVLHEVNNIILFNVSIDHEYHINTGLLKRVFENLLSTFNK